jgi:uncharacterized protein YjbJ (UPF0337 family)
MRASSWVAAGIGLGVGLTILFMNEYREAEAAYGGGYSGIEDAARRTFGWGTKNRVKGTVQSISGGVKAGVGRFTGDDRMVGEGSLERAVGDLKDVMGTLGQTAGQTLHDLNR